MFIYILITLAAVLAVISILALRQPPEFRVERKMLLTAQPSAAYSLVNDFHQWRAWSPWEDADPSMRRVFEGPTAGIGAVYRWAGNRKVGEGSMRIIESRAAESVLIRLEFLKPFKATNTTVFTFKSEGDLTEVTWSMTGRNNFIAKVFHLFMNMDEMVGRDFEKGLTMMRLAMEKGPAQMPRETVYSR